MVSVSSKGKEKVLEGKVVKPKPYSTSSTRKLMSDAMKENKVRTIENKRRRRAMVDEDHIPNANMVEVSKVKSDSKNRI